MKFIKVHDKETGKQEIYVNTSAIESVLPYKNADNTVHTRIYTITDNQSYYAVAESVEEVMRMIMRSDLCLM